MKKVLLTSIVVVILSVSINAQAKVFDCGFELEPAFQGWETKGNVVVRNEDCGCIPTEGEKAALLRTQDSPIDFDFLTAGMTSPTPISELFDFLGFSESELLNGSGQAGLDLVQGAGLKTQATFQAGEMISFDWNFMTDEKPGATHLDSAYVCIGDEHFLLADKNDAVLPAVQDDYFAKETGYNKFVYTFTESGTFDIVFSVFNEKDAHSSFQSGLCLDNIDIKPIPVPFSAMIMMLGLGLIGGMPFAHRHAGRLHTQK